MFLLIILLIIFLILALNNKLIEGMDRNISNQGSKPYSTVKRFYGGTFNSTFDGRSAIDDQYFYDKLFNDVAYYPNIYDDNDRLIETGWLNCMKECPGNCIEYGMTANTYCFPY